MGLYQRSVLKHYLASLDDSKVTAAYNNFKLFFFNHATQQNIRNSKEEQFQEGFLRELFVKIMGYTLNPDADYNLISEQKNVSDSKKADGAIIIDGKVVGVIELKGTNTIDLGKIQQQAFYYLSAHPEAVYVITSNFEKLRFYIQKSNDYEEFNLFTLTLEDFKLLYLCTSLENVRNGIPLKIKQESLVKEEIITKQLYKDYSSFKQDLFYSLCKQNQLLDKLTLFKATQKLIDRFLFIFFCEDNNGLLPANSISEIIKHWNRLRDMDEYRPLYDIFKKYFEYINSGRAASGDKREIFAYNGGLFAEDVLLDNLRIDDTVLYSHTQKISTYDFISEVDVNILGHIFEHSLNDIEEIQAEIEGKVLDKSKTRRKKDGVFYTPKYITEYIVENTVGKLCADKKAELNIDEDQFVTAKTPSKRAPLLEKLNAYKSYLLGITICDPACGSGAFLNQAYVFLQKEHQYVADLESKLFDAPMVISDVSADILENNLFGVDINEESVEIARLALWLRSAKKGRKLNNLSNTIKCGNSLIDDPEVAGDKAFNWEEQFPQVFAKGGFDVVIGNPPYVNANDIKKNFKEREYKFVKANYRIAQGTVDLYLYFFELGLIILKNNGILSFITPNRFLSASYGRAFREILLNEYKLKSLIDFSDKNVFQDASTYPVITFIENIRDNVNYDVVTGYFDEFTKQMISTKYPSQELKILDEYILGFLLNDKIGITLKVFDQSTPFEECCNINATSTASEADLYSGLITEDFGYKLVNTGTIDPYMTFWGINELTDKGRKYLTPFLPIESNFISLNRHNLYSSPKIIISKIGLKCEAFYDKLGEYASINTNCVYNFKTQYLPEYILCWLNSKLYNYTFECLFDGLRMSGGYLLFSAPNIKNTKIKLVPLVLQHPFVEMANKMQNFNNAKSEKKVKFLSRIQSNLQIEKITSKLEKFYEHDFKSFLGELKKQKVVMSLKYQDEWEDYFNAYKQEINNLQTEITKTDMEIDQIVYELYGLSEEEIRVVENG